jgi:8-amino-7-oxononanoate synthase
MTIDQDICTPWKFDTFVPVAQREGALFEIPTVDGSANETFRWGEKNLVNFASINFLGLHQDARIFSHFLQSARDYGLVTGGSRISQGVSRPHAELENLLSRITGKERSLSFASGLLANLGFVTGISARFMKSSSCQLDNSDTVFVMDNAIHWSIRRSVEHLPRDQQRFYFKHDDMADLERILAMLAGKKVVVVFESVHSMFGDVAPMGEIIDLCERYGAISYVDDANGFLIYGPEQRPFAHEFTQIRRATFRMVSFSKSIGLEGGAIAGPDDAIQAFEILSGTSVFTAAIQPPTASTIHLIMQYLSEDHALIDRYLERVAAFRRRLEEIDCQLNATPSYIITIFVGAEEKIAQVRSAFLERGYLVSALGYPIVKRDHALIRILMNWYHTEEHLEGFITTLKELKERYQF